jgi:hypothetical protein
VRSLVLLLIIFAVPIGTLACSCAPPADPQTALEQADIVFAGRVVGLQIVPAAGDEATSDPAIEDLIVTFSVTAIWKWPDEINLPDIDMVRLDLRTAYTCCVCGYPFALGDTYLVYATGDIDALSTSICTRTARLEDAQEDVAVFGPAIFAAPPPAQAE